MGIETGTAMLIGAAISAIGAGASIAQGMETSRQQKNAARKQEAQAKKANELSAQETKRQNSSEADVSSLLEQNSKAGLSGGSTLLTGAQGVDKSKLSLGGGSNLG